MNTYTVRLFVDNLDILECNITAPDAETACDKMLRRFGDLYATDCVKKLEVYLNGHVIYYKRIREIA